MSFGSHGNFQWVQTQPQIVYITHAALIECSAFGKPNLLKTYTVIPNFSHTLVPVFSKSHLLIA
jgi:hypothetical protein